MARSITKSVTIEIVTLKEPCTACQIIEGLIRDMLKKLKAQYDVEVVNTILQHPKEAATVEGLEVEKFPALLINGEQITAGSLPRLDQLKRILEAEIYE